MLSRLMPLVSALALFFGLCSSMPAQPPAKDKTDAKTKADPKAKADPKDPPKSRFNTQITVEAVSLGKQLAGPKLTKDDLKGKVVLYDMWGINCPPCLAAMPATAALYRELADYGFVVIGAHSQPGSVADVLEFSTGRGATFPIFASAGVRGTDDNNALPHVVLFDHTGNCVFRGLPDEAEGKIRLAVGEMIVAGAEQEKFNTSLAPIAAELKKGRSPVSLIPRLTPLLVSANKETVAQANALLGSLTAPGRRKLDEAKEKAGDEPLEAFLLAEKLPASYKGTPVGKQATELVDKLKKEKPVNAELAARPSLETVRQLTGQLNAKLGKGDASKPEFRKPNAAQIKQLENKINQMKKSWPDARATADAGTLAEKFLTGS